MTISATHSRGSCTALDVEGGPNTKGQWRVHGNILGIPADLGACLLMNNEG